MTSLSLFSGIGGLDLAAERAGIKTVAMCEIDPFCRRVLKKHWPDVPIFKDVFKLRGEDVGPVDVIHGGFPCQPFSVAGKQTGRNDIRYLWPEFSRIIREIKPNWVVGENVEGSVRMVLDEIIDDLEGIGYEVQAFVVSAYCAGAWFDGRRVFIVASSNNRRPAMWRDSQLQTDEAPGRSWNFDRGGTEEFDPGERWSLKSRPYGVAHGVPHRVDRLRALGNAVVPQQADPIFRAIIEIERERP